MNTEMMLDILSGIEDDLIDEYFVIGEKARKTRTARKLWTRIAAAVVSLALVLVVSAWLFVPPNFFKVLEQPGKPTFTFKINDLNAVYEYYYVDDISRFDRWNLENNIGERYTSVYTDGGHFHMFKLKGHDDIEKLIIRDSIGNHNIIEFVGFANDEGLGVNLGLTMGDVLKTVYNIASSDEIKSITFSKADSGGGKIEESVIVPTIKIKDREQIERIFSIFSPLNYGTHEKISYVTSTFSEYIEGKEPLAVQTNRTITVKLYDGRTYEWKFYPSGNCISIGAQCGIISEQDMAWLIDLAQIDMEYRYWGTHKDVFVGETAEPSEAE